MLKQIVAIAALAAATGAAAQMPAGAPAAVCPAGTRFAAIRHSLVGAGKMALFEQAVADHNAWYAAHHDKTVTRLVHLVTRTATGIGLAPDEAATITVYSGAPTPDHDAAYAAFTAKYKASSTIKDEMRACLPALAN